MRPTPCPSLGRGVQWRKRLPLRNKALTFLTPHSTLLTPLNLPSPGRGRGCPLQRIFLKSVEDGGEIAFASVGQESDYALALVLGTLGYLGGGKGGGT